MQMKLLSRDVIKTSVFLLVLLSLSLLVIPALAQSGSDAGCELDLSRINNRPHRDCDAPVQIYTDTQKITILTQKINVNPAQFIASFDLGGPIPTGANEIIVEALNPLTNRPVIVSRLTTGEYQLNTFRADGTAYIVVWYGTADLYHIDPVTGQPLDGARPIIVTGATNPSAGASAGLATSSTTAPASGTPAPGSTTVTSPTNVGGDLTNCRVTTTRMVRLREESNTTSGVLTTLPYRSTWRVTEIEPGWYRVIYLNTQGWVSADFVNPIGTCA